MKCVGGKGKCKRNERTPCLRYEGRNNRARDVCKILGREMKVEKRGKIKVGGNIECMKWKRKECEEYICTERKS
jgi:hypothetical protein